MPGKAGRRLGLILPQPARRWYEATLFKPTWRAAADLLGLFFPSRCRVCQTPLHAVARLPICARCWLDAAPIADHAQCNVCGLPTGLRGVEVFQCQQCIAHPPRFALARSYGEYGGALRSMIHLLKYDEMIPLASPLGERLASVARAGDFGTCDAVAAVPLESSRRRARGYNQAELLAKVVARRMTLPLLDASALRRTRATTSQAGLTRAQRRENVRGAFEAQSKAVKDRVILLIDDVMTTGATLDACAAALRNAGATRVLCLSVARTPEPELNDANEPRQ